MKWDNFVPRPFAAQRGRKDSRGYYAKRALGTVRAIIPVDHPTLEFSDERPLSVFGLAAGSAWKPLPLICGEKWDNIGKKPITINIRFWSNGCPKPL